MLRQRVITGFILSVLVVDAIYLLSNQYFALLALFCVVGIGAWEWAGLTGTTEAKPRILVAVMTMVAAYLLVLLNVPLLPVLLLSVVVWASIIWFLPQYQSGTAFYKNRPYLLKSLSFLVLIPAWYALSKLHGEHYAYVFYLIALVALADIGAYFAGKRFGKTKLAPNLSPGKTREGVYGALAVTFVWAILGAVISDQSGINILLFIAFSMIAVVMSVLGDLFESLIKREAGAKDSGTLLPGHGGVLDRVDGLLAAAPLFALGLLWIKAG